MNTNKFQNVNKFHDKRINELIYVPNIHPQYIRRGEDIASVSSGERWFRSNIKNSYTEIN